MRIGAGGAVHVSGMVAAVATDSQALTRTREQAAIRRWYHKISRMRRSYETQRDRL
jgi:tRNA G26 N,N-dimethylase Trm1